MNPLELASEFNVPKEEILSFLDCGRIYNQGSIVINEGELDKTLYLLRVGEVEVSKRISEQEHRTIAMIQAVNFFGEMAVINDEARSATVKISSKVALVYAIARPKLNLILSNPVWSELLLSRLTRDLAKTDEKLKETSRTAAELVRDKDYVSSVLAEYHNHHKNLLKNVARILSVIKEFNSIVQNEAVVGSRGWHYLGTLNEINRVLVRNYIPEIMSLEQPTDPVMIKEVIKELENQLPKSMVELVNQRLRG
jgi:signal-transduction protein with cAMP-binding, CBS, and nucleotidyltransferase domain